MRHDILAKELYKEIRREDNPNSKEIKSRSITEAIDTHRERITGGIKSEF